MKINILKILRNPFFIVPLVLVVAVSIKVKSNYSSGSEAELEQKVKDRATEIMVHLDHMKEMINRDFSDENHMEDIAQMKLALTSRDKICSLEERDYIKKIDLNNIKSSFNDKYTFYQTDFYFKLQDNILHMAKVIDVEKKYSEDYPNYIKSNAFKLKNTIENYSNCEEKNVITEAEYETFLKTFISYENETIDQFKIKVRKDLASL